jgi:hypothetical protein
MIHAYADDSVNATDAIYAALVLPDRLCEVALSHLADFKISLQVPIRAELHCRILFNASARRRSEWAHVDLKAAEPLLRKLCQELRRVSAAPVSASMPLRGPVAPRLGDDHPMRISEVKGVATLGYMAMHQELLDRFGRVGVRLWLDFDGTKIPWGQGRRQAHLTREFFSKLEGEDMPALAHPDREPPPHPQLFEVADLYAYALANRERGTGAAIFSELCEIVGLRPSGGIFGSESQWQSADAPPRFGQVMWRLRRADETALCLSSEGDAQ